MIHASRESITSGSSSSSVAPKGDQLVCRGGRHLSQDGCDENLVGNLRPAYPHQSQVDYYSCTNNCWLRGTVTLDAQHHFVDRWRHLEPVVYGVHLRKPFATGSVVEVCTRHKTMWKPAIIAKIMLIRRTESTLWNSTGGRWSCLDLPSGSAFWPRVRCPVVCVRALGGSVSFETKATLTRTTVGRKTKTRRLGAKFQQTLSVSTLLGTTFSHNSQDIVGTSLLEHVLWTLSFRFHPGTSNVRDGNPKVLVNEDPLKDGSVAS